MDEERSVEGYPRLEKAQEMLDVLHRLLTEAEQVGATELTVIVDRGVDQVGVRLSYFDPDGLHGRNVNLSEELGWSGAQTVGLFRWAESAGYIRPSYDSTGRDIALASAHLEYLEPKGYELIGELPDPQERLVLVLEAAIRAVQRDEDLSQQEKKRRIDLFEEAKFVIRTLGVEAAKAVLRGDLPPM